LGDVAWQVINIKRSVTMYSIVVGKLQKSLVYVFQQAIPAAKESRDENRHTFLRLFGLYRSLEAFITNLEKALAELDSLASGGAVVRTVVHNKLDTVKLSAHGIGDSICASLTNMAGYFSIEEADSREKALHEMGLYRFYPVSPVDGHAKSTGMSHCYEELCPFVPDVDGKASFEIVYTLTEPALAAQKLYEGIDYNAVPFMEQPEYVRKGISRNINAQLLRKKVDMRSAEQVGQILTDNSVDIELMHKRKQELAGLIRKSFTVENLL
jgi:hypothetical protein